MPTDTATPMPPMICKTCEPFQVQSTHQGISSIRMTPVPIHINPTSTKYHALTPRLRNHLRHRSNMGYVNKSITTMPR